MTGSRDKVMAMTEGCRAGRLQIHACRWLSACRTMRLCLQCALLLAFACAPGPGARAAEHITLSNGFELNCDHRGISSEGTDVRLYLDAAEANYLDVKLGEITGSAFLPPGAPSPALVAKPGGGPRAGAAVKPELSPAELHELLASAGVEHNLDVDLLASLVHAESNSRPNAVSRAGAQGLMQLMPSTAAQLGITDAFAPEANVHGGTAYLDSLLKRYHDNLALALAAYNAGPAAVDRYHGVPPYRETRAYVARIIHEFNRRYAGRQAAASLAIAR